MLQNLLLMPAYNLVESFVDAFRDSVRPVPGSIVYCDLLMGYMEHSGVYIGNNQIVHLTGNGDIEIVSPQEFVEGTTALNIYVSCRGESAVGSKLAAAIAKNQVGRARSYNFVLDNCHQFATGCLSGNFENSNNFLWMLKDECRKELDTNTWRCWDINLFS